MEAAKFRAVVDKEIGPAEMRIATERNVIRKCGTFPVAEAAMRTVLIALLATVLVSTVFSQVISRRETLTVGVDLTLGVSEDAAVKKLTESGYKLSKHDPPDALKQKGFTSMWSVEERGERRRKSHAVCWGDFVFFRTANISLERPVAQRR